MNICWSDVSFPPPPQIHPLYNKRIKKWAKKTKQNQEKRKIEEKKFEKGSVKTLKNGKQT